MTMWEANPLPRGRHGLSRENVEAAQRSRIFAAMVHAVAERGYAATPVAEILRRAGVSRETFYQLYSSKLDCFLECLDQATADFLAQVAADRPADNRSPRVRFGQLLETCLNVLADDPDRARVFLVEAYAAGPEAIIARTNIQDEFVDVILDELGTQADRFACESLVAAISARVTLLLASDDAEGLRELGSSYVDLAERLGVV